MKLLIRHITKLILLFIFLSSSLFAQEKNSDSVFVMHKSPWGAVLRSAVLPGWGQLYNQSYVKAPIVWGVSTWLVFNWIQQNKQYKDYQKLYIQNQNPNYKVIRDFYHDQRDLFAIYMGITYVLNMVDAYVDAHLFDFSVEEDPHTGNSMLNMRVRF